MADALSLQVWPLKVQLKNPKKALEIEFDDGSLFIYSAEYLRIASPSAELKGHGSSQRQVLPGQKNVEIIEIKPVGNYAIRIIFDDKHDTGIYSWKYLYQLGEQYEANWQRYLHILESLGLTRDH